MEHTYQSGQRYVLNGHVLHIKRVYPDGCLTSRGMKSFQELQHYKLEEKPKRVDTAEYKSVRLSKEEHMAVLRIFGNPSAAIRWAIANVIQEAKS